MLLKLLINEKLTLMTKCEKHKKFAKNHAVEKFVHQTRIKKKKRLFGK